MVRGNKRSGSSLSSASKKKAVKGRLARRRGLERRGETRHEEEETGRSTMAACRESDAALSFARRTDNSSGFDSPSETSAR